MTDGYCKFVDIPGSNNASDIKPTGNTECKAYGNLGPDHPQVRIA
jgi:hypothetical protein